MFCWAAQRSHEEMSDLACTVVRSRDLGNASRVTCGACHVTCEAPSYMCTSSVRYFLSWNRGNEMLIGFR